MIPPLLLRGPSITNLVPLYTDILRYIVTLAQLQISSMNNFFDRANNQNCISIAAEVSKTSAQFTNTCKIS